MELRDYIAEGTKKAGTMTELGRIIGVRQQEMTTAKAHRRALPLDACVKLADYLDAPLRSVIAANELATEKKEEKQAFWLQFVKTAQHAAAAAVFVGVTSLVTPSPVEAAPLNMTQRYEFVLC